MYVGWSRTGWIRTPQGDFAVPDFKSAEHDIDIAGCTLPLVGRALSSPALRPPEPELISLERGRPPRAQPLEE
jgi:hypothetical protein